MRLSPVAWRSSGTQLPVPAVGAGQGGKSGDSSNHEPDQAARKERGLDLGPEFVHEQEQVHKTGQSAWPAVLVSREFSGYLEQLLHLHRWPGLHEYKGLCGAGVGKVVRRTGRYRDGLTRPDDPAAPTDAEPQAPLDNGEALLLPGVDVPAGHPAPGGQPELPRQQVPSGLDGRDADSDPFAAGGVFDYGARDVVSSGHGPMMPGPTVPPRPARNDNPVKRCT
jgi:hypothetical protein